MNGQFYKQANIQILRAFAIIAVVIIHTYGTETVGLIVRPFVNYAVALFLFLSGYLTTRQSNSRVFSRIIRALVPYMIWTAVYSVAFHDISLWNFVLAKQPQTFYYILVYIQITLLIPASMKLLESKYYWIGLIISPVYVICLKYLPIILNFTINDDFSRNIFLPWYSFFILGMMIRNKGISALKPKKMALLYILAIALSIVEELIWFKVFNNYDFAVSQLKMTSLLSSVVTCLIANSYIQREKDRNEELYNTKTRYALIQIGEYSFGIYLIHWMIRSIALKILPDYLELFPVLTFLVLREPLKTMRNMTSVG